LRRKAKKPDREGEDSEDEGDDGEEEEEDDDENKDDDDEEEDDDEDEYDEDEEEKSLCSIFTTPVPMSRRHLTLVLQTGQVLLRCNHGWMQARWKMCYKAII
jgi:hypothetical protein